MSNLPKQTEQDTLKQTGKRQELQSESKRPGWIGFQRRMLWNWLQLLVVPVSLAVGAALITVYLERQADVRQDVAMTDRTQQETLTNYLVQMTELLLEKRLLKSQPGSAEQIVARASTLTALRELDGERKGQLLQFLYEAGLVSRECRTPKAGLKKQDCTGIIPLYEANLKGADLEEANLGRANLGGADLEEAELEEANLEGANLKEAKLKEGNLEGANLRGANLERANLGQAKLEGTFLGRANLTRTNLGKANLGGAFLTRALLIRANLERADLGGSDLEEANLVGANLEGANLAGADLGRANLKGANLLGAKLLGTNLSQACYSKDTLFDQGFDPHSRGLLSQEKRPDLCSPL